MIQMIKRAFFTVGILGLGISLSVVKAQNTGIGTTNPTNTLHIKPDTSLANPDPIRIENLRFYSSGADSALLVCDPATGIVRYMSLSSFVSGDGEWSNVTGNAIYANRAWANGNPIVITGDGKLGIGTTAPSSRLEIEGTTKVKKTGTAQLQVINPDTTDNLNPAEIVFYRTAVANNQKSAVGVGGTARDFFIWHNGKDRMNIIEDGNVGINTKSPTAKLDVNGTFRVRYIDQATAEDSAFLVVNPSDGTVHFKNASEVAGGSSPWEMVDTSATAYTYLQELNNAQSEGDYVRFRTSGGGDLEIFDVAGTSWQRQAKIYGHGMELNTWNTPWAPNFNFRRSNGSSGNATSLSQGNPVGELNFHAQNDTWSNNGFLQLQTKVDTTGNWALSGNNMPLDFLVKAKRQNSGAETNLIVKANGNVGVGTTNPDAKLEVQGQGKIVKDGVKQLMIINPDPTDNPETAEIAFQRVAVANSQKSAVGVGGTGRDFFISHNGIDRINIDQDGHVGIGNLNPEYLLDAPDSSRVGQNLLHENMELNYFGSGNRFSYLDFHTQDSSDYDARIIKRPGAAGRMFIVNKGGGNLTLNTDAPGDQMIIDGGTGNVGIGVGGASEKLDVNGGLRVRTIPLAETNDTSVLVTDPATGVVRYMNIGDLSSPGSDVSSVWFGSDDNAGANTLGESIYHNGRVGLGVTNPTVKLDVNGSLKVSNIPTATAGDDWVLVTNPTAGLVTRVEMSSLGGEWAKVGGNTVYASEAWSNGKPVVVTDNGRLGVGTTTPNVPLEINGETWVSKSGNGQLRIFNPNTSDNLDPAEIVFDRSQVAGTQRSAIGVGGTARDFFIWHNGADRLTIDEAGRVGIGKDDPTENLHVGENVRIDQNLYINRNGSNSYPGRGNSQTGLSVVGNSEGASLSISLDAAGDPVNVNRNSNGNVIGFYQNGTYQGGIAVNGSTVAYNTTSDVRLKENIQATQFGLGDLMKLNVVDYNFIADQNKTPLTGFLAQELANIFPQAVKEGGDNPETDPWAVDHSKLVPLLVKALQDQQKQIDALKATIEAMK
ncbi:MAG: tail fiber domain-containing protein [Bacteroidota bacterium]